MDMNRGLNERMNGMREKVLIYFCQLISWLLSASPVHSDPDKCETCIIIIMPTIRDAKDQVERVLGVDKKKDPGSLEWLSHYLSDLRQSSSAKQVTVGAASGWASGFVCGKFGRTAATAVGGTVICLHLAQQYGYITVNWKQVNGDVAKAKKELEKKARDEVPELMKRLQAFLVENILLAGGFGGGFLLGLASS